MNNFFKTFHSTPTSCVPFIFGQTGLKQVQVTPKVVMLQPVADGLHLGQLLQEQWVLDQPLVLAGQDALELEPPAGRLALLLGQEHVQLGIPTTLLLQLLNGELLVLGKLGTNLYQTVAIGPVKLQ